MLIRPYGRSHERYLSLPHNQRYQKEKYKQSNNGLIEVRHHLSRELLQAVACFLKIPAIAANDKML